MTLPGMPIRYGDPGFFVCKIDDGAPPSPERAAPAAPVPAPRPKIWLVLALCPHCVPRTGKYCAEHGPNNWWLTHWGRPVK